MGGEHISLRDIGMCHNRESMLEVFELEHWEALCWLIYIYITSTCNFNYFYKTGPAQDRIRALGWPASRIFDVVGPRPLLQATRKTGTTSSPASDS
jgi:hypothetical protein